MESRPERWLAKTHPGIVKRDLKKFEPLMLQVLVGIRYKGQPVYKRWNDKKTEVSFYSRETKPVKKGWKVTFYVKLLAIKIDRRRGLKNIAHQVNKACDTVKHMRGVTKV